MILSKEAIAAAPDLNPETVDVPEWGGSVLLRGLTAGEYQHFALHGQTMLNDGSLNAWVVAKALMDDAGQPIFGPNDDGVTVLSQKSGMVIKTLAEHVMKLSGLAADEADATGAKEPVDAALGN